MAGNKITVGELRHFLENHPDDDAEVVITLPDGTPAEVWEMWRQDDTARITLVEANR